VGEGDRHLHSKAIDRDAWLARMEGKVDQNRHGPLSSKCLVEAHNRTFTLRHLVTGLLAQAVKYRIELRIFELLRNDRARHPEIADRKAGPLEVSVMAGGKDAGTGRSNRAGEFFEASQIDQLPIIRRVDPRAPKEIDHRGGKLLVGLARDSGALGRGKPIAESRLQIAQGNPSPLQIEMSRQRTGEARELHGEPAREPRNDGGEQAHAEPLQLIANRFPS